MLKNLTVAYLLALCPLLLSAQTKIIRGVVESARTEEKLPGVEVRLPAGNRTTTDAVGAFLLETSLPGGKVLVTFEGDGYQSLDQEIDLTGQEEIDMGVIALRPEENIDQIGAEDLIPIITLSVNDLESEGAQNISGVLTASRDVFVSTAAFVFGPARFRIRGLDSEYTTILMNGIPVNDPESGRVFWSNWGGLNDVTRYRDNSIGLGAVSYAFGNVGGASSFDTRAGTQRKQLRLTYSLANRTYRNRVMATYSSGQLQGGWAISASGSRRWAEEGYQPGTFYDAWAYFLSVDKKLGSNHTLNLTTFGAPIRRGRSTAATEEMYDLAGTNYYNPNWGFQNGEKRNARVGNTHQPMAILRHDWEISKKTTLMTAAAYQFGRNGSTALDWYDARDPRPDYYRRLPSFIDNEQAAAVEQVLRESEAARQIDWDQIYAANRNSFATIENADGIDGNTVSGLRAQYIIEDRRFDDQRYVFNTVLESILSDQVTLNGGASYIWHKGSNFKVVDDLLGADFYVDIDKFAEFDSTANNAFIQNDIDTPNRILREGDRWGYDYDIHVRKAAAWFQTDLTFPRIDLFFAGNAGNTTFWRFGNVRNGKFPDNSGGESERQNFFEYGAKAGLTYKIDGRNYLMLNGGYISQAPSTRDAYVSPRTRHDAVQGLETRKVLSLEGGYLLQAPYAKARVMGYFTQFNDLLWNRSFYLDNAIITDDGTRGGFVNYIMPGISTRHLGLELAAEVQIAPGLKVNGVAAIGEYTYRNRPEVTIFLDNVAEQLSEQQVFIENFYLSGTPQTAYSVGLNYRSKQFWFANLNFNYFDNVWIDFNPARRTVEAVSFVQDPQFQEQTVDPESQLWRDIIEQEKAPSAFTVDFFGGKSFKLGKVFLYLNVGVSNILDNQDFVTGGYEQLRFDFEDKDVDQFPNRLFYSFGRNYFVNLSFRI